MDSEDTSFRLKSHFPFLRSGAETGWADLTALAVVSVELYDKDGSAVRASDPIHVSVPLPSDTRNRMATSVPVWLYQPTSGKENPCYCPRAES